jgi:hypothetical protein
LGLVLPGRSPLRMVAGLTWSVDTPAEALSP